MWDFELPSTGRKIPDVVNCRYDRDRQFYTSRYNFPVQGTGADILHATAALTPVLALESGITEFGYVLARHDEICYSVASPHSRDFAEIGNSVHCWAWAIFLEGLGYDWFPQPLARLASINIDRVYRKEVDAPTDSGYGLGWTFPDGLSIT